MYASLIGSSDTHISLIVVFLWLFGNKLCMFWPINFETWNLLKIGTCVLTHHFLMS